MSSPWISASGGAQPKPSQRGASIQTRLWTDTRNFPERSCEKKYSTTADARRWKRRDGEKAVRLMYPGRSGQGDWRIISSKFTSICVYLRLILLHIANPADPQNFQGSYTWDEENSNHGGTRINTDEKMGMMLSSFFKTSQNRI
jgi:hypothetical protein